MLFKIEIVFNKIQEFCIHLYKVFGQLSDISFIFLKTFASKYTYSEISFTDQNSIPLDIENRINITLVID